MFLFLISSNLDALHMHHNILIYVASIVFLCPFFTVQIYATYIIAGLIAVWQQIIVLFKVQ